MDGYTIADLTYAFRIFLNVYLCVLTVIFYFSFLTLREKRGFVSSCIVLFLLRSATTLLCIPLYAFFVIKIVVHILLDFLSVHLLFQDSIPRKAILASFTVVLGMLSEALVFVMGALWLGVSVPMITDDPDITIRLAPFFLLSYSLCYGLPSLFARLWPKGNASISLSRFMILPVSQMLMMGGFMYSFFLSERQFDTSDAVITAIMIVACVAVDLIFVRVIHDLVQKKQLEEQQALQTRHYAALMKQQQSIRALRHDLANHLMTVNVLAQRDAVQSEEYIQNLTRQFREMTAIDFCENKIADAVLFGKHVEAATAGIDFTVDAVLPEETGVEDLDLMSLMSNLIDNALDAAKLTEEKQISVSLRKETGAVLLKVENSIPSGRAVDLRRTTKANKRMHGLGIGIAESICKKYRGSLSIRQEGNSMLVSATLLI